MQNFNDVEFPWRVNSLLQCHGPGHKLMSYEVVLDSVAAVEGDEQKTWTTKMDHPKMAYP